MKSPYHSTDPQEGPTPQQIAAWSLILRQWQSRLAPFFARPEVLAHALLYLQAILSDIPRKNGWQIAEHARQSRPYGMQRLLSRAVWDQDGVRSYLGWYRHITLVLLASAVLVGICVQDGIQPVRAPHQDEVISPLAPALSALTPSEVQHLLARLIWPLPASVPLVCAWSRFRRIHQYWAGYYHRRRRLKAASP